MLRKLESQPHVLSGRIAESSKLASGKIIRKSLSTGKASELAVESCRTMSSCRCGKERGLAHARVCEIQLRRHAGIMAWLGCR